MPGRLKPRSLAPKLLAGGDLALEHDRAARVGARRELALADADPAARRAAPTPWSQARDHLGQLVGVDADRVVRDVGQAWSSV